MSEKAFTRIPTLRTSGFSKAIMQFKGGADHPFQNGAITVDQANYRNQLLGGRVPNPPRKANDEK